MRFSHHGRRLIPCGVKYYFESSIGSKRRGRVGDEEAEVLQVAGLLGVNPKRDRDG